MRTCILLVLLTTIGALAQAAEPQASAVERVLAAPR